MTNALSMTHAWKNLISHTYFLCKIHHSLVVLRNPSSILARTTLDSKVTQIHTKSHKTYKLWQQIIMWKVLMFIV